MADVRGTYQGLQELANKGASEDEMQDFLQSSGVTLSQLKAFEKLSPAKKIVAAEPMSAAERFGMGAMDPLHGAAQLLLNSLPTGVVENVNKATQYVNELPVIGPATKALGMVPETAAGINTKLAEREAEYQARRGDEGLDVARLGGNVAGSLPLAFAAPAATTVGGSVAAGTAGGTVGALTSPVTGGDYWDEKKSQATSGAAIGALTGPLGYAAGRVISPNISPDVKSLNALGVEMTPGQILGGGFKRAEDTATSIPLIGDKIATAQARSIQSFNRAVGNEILKPMFGAKIPKNVPAGRDMVEWIDGAISAQYQRLVPRITMQADKQFNDDVQNIGKRFLTPDAANTFERFVTDSIVSRLNNGPMDGATYKTIKASLREVANRYRQSPMPADRELAQQFDELQKSFNELLYRSNPKIAKELKSVDKAYAGFVRVMDAASRDLKNDGVFTPSQLMAAVKKQDKSMAKRTFAKGDAMMQESAQRALNVLPSVIPNSGTTDRALMATLLAGGAASGAGMIPAAPVLGGAAIYGAYSQPAMTAFQKLMLSPRNPSVDQLGNVLAQRAPYLAAPLAQPATGRQQ